jgi:hypothetical protein
MYFFGGFRAGQLEARTALAVDAAREEATAELEAYVLESVAAAVRAVDEDIAETHASILREFEAAEARANGPPPPQAVMRLAFPIVNRVLCGAFVWVRRALNIPKWRFPARAESERKLRELQDSVALQVSSPSARGTAVGAVSHDDPVGLGRIGVAEIEAPNRLVTLV